MEFANLKSIQLNKPETWQDKIFLTFDIDWASDEVLNFTIDILEESKAKATFFCTHETKVLDRVRKNPDFEIAVHPNFNFLLNGDHRYGSNVKEVAQYYMDIVPESVTLRSHSLTQNSQILEVFCDLGIRSDCNLLIPLEAGETKPFLYSNNRLLRIPYIWEDDTAILYRNSTKVTDYLQHDGLKVFDFHPIHVFLNTETLDRYNRCRKHLQNYTELKSFVNHESFGTQNFFKNLIQQSKLVTL
ncbi:hypothetical protein [uncultured Microscilla sp.]|uniref:polysaccharide deacetylase WbmS family protein n=1 Tax=uncultured Microscilla sp. TaxID=432653 RepID=UPI002624913E|nr:hypothetical protein [uncultured Microscilla sp.]